MRASPDADSVMIWLFEKILSGSLAVDTGLILYSVVAFAVSPSVMLNVLLLIMKSLMSVDSKKCPSVCDDK